MLYEKKMLILSGDGKGVVLIEKSANGVKFSLRTFDMPHCGELKAGVITRSVAVVRDLPGGTNPAAVFSLDPGDISSLHFAVFDKKLRLYGCIGKRMWESNVMDLLNRSDRRAPNVERMPIAPLPPIATPPKVLPMPDGTGIPQSRLALYGDEALAESDFYTPLDISERMPIVDKFLDTPRVLPQELAPRVVPHEFVEQPTEEITGFAVEGTVTESMAKTDRAGETVVMDGDETSAKTVDTIETPTAANEKIESDAGSERTSDADMRVMRGTDAEVREPITKSALQQDPDEIDPARAVAATAEQTVELGTDMPWELQARWILNRSHRKVTVRKTEVKPIEHKQTVKHVRDMAFIEIARDDIEKLFRHAERDGTLKDLLPDLEWIRVETDGNVISVGRGDGVLCYAVAGVYAKTSPLGEQSQWLPSDRNTPTGKGYWLIFQSMIDGTIIYG